MALHPDDPPVDAALGGAARIFTSPVHLARALDQAHGSPAWGLNLCLGSVSEMGGQAAVDEVIDTFGPAGRICYVHFRDVAGQVPAFAECFLGEGNFDPVAVIRRLDAVGFDGFLIDDHVPAVEGDVDTWGIQARRHTADVLENARTEDCISCAQYILACARARSARAASSSPVLAIGLGAIAVARTTAARWPRSGSWRRSGRRQG